MPVDCVTAAFPTGSAASQRLQWGWRCLELCTVPLWDVKKQNFTCHQPRSPSAATAPWTLSPQDMKSFCFSPFAQTHREMGFFQVLCLHWAIFLKNQQPILMDTASYVDDCQLRFLPRNPETASECCFFSSLKPSHTELRKKIPWPLAYKAKVRALWETSIHACPFNISIREAVHGCVLHTKEGVCKQCD